MIDSSYIGERLNHTNQLYKKSLPIRERSGDSWTRTNGSPPVGQVRNTRLALLLLAILV